MPLARKTTSTILPDELQQQIAANFSKEEPETPAVSSAVTSASAVSSASASSSTEEKAKSKYSDSVNLRLSSGKRVEFKSFFSKYDLNMTLGFEMAVDYIIKEVKAGRVTLSKSGITRVEE